MNQVDIQRIVEKVMVELETRVSRQLKENIDEKECEKSFIIRRLIG